MPDDVPSDVQAVVIQLLDETDTALRAGEFQTARRAIDTVETVSRNKLPAGELRGQLLHGCAAALTALESDDSNDADLAAEYVRAMTQRLPEA